MFLASVVRLGAPIQFLLSLSLSPPPRMGTEHWATSLLSNDSCHPGEQVLFHLRHLNTARENSKSTMNMGRLKMPQNLPQTSGKTPSQKKGTALCQRPRSGKLSWPSAGTILSHSSHPPTHGVFQTTWADESPILGLSIIRTHMHVHHTAVATARLGKVNSLSQPNTEPSSPASPPHRSLPQLHNRAH